MLYDLPGYRVVDAWDAAAGGREVLLVATATAGACPTCGVLSARVHQWSRQRVRDVPVAGALKTWWNKRRWVCAESACGRRTFAEHSEQVPARARITRRLGDLLVDEVAQRGCPVSGVAAVHGVSWHAVQSRVDAAVLSLPDPELACTRRLGIDEHRFRSVRFFRDVEGTWRRYEPWMTTFIDLDTSAVLGIVDGRSSAGVGAWLGARSQRWRDAVQVVAIDPSAAFRKALREHLPTAAVSVDAFHLIKLGNDMVTAVRQRLSRQQQGRRGRAGDGAWAHRLLLLRAGDTLSAPARRRLQRVLRDDDPTSELSAAWGVKEQLRRLLGATTLDDAADHAQVLAAFAELANMAETDKILTLINAWWPEIEVLIATGVTNARTEAANTNIKHIKRTARGFRNPHNYRGRILLTSAVKRAA